MFLMVCCSVGTSRAQTAFTEEAVSRGINYVTAYPTLYGAGVAFADLDGDGDPDVVVVGATGGQVGVYENNGSGSFVTRTGTTGIPVLPQASGIAVADYDGDGDLDLYITTVGTSNRLLRNEGSFVFSDVTVEALVGDEGAGQGCAWGDYDGDGWLDLYVGNRTEPGHPEDNRLYRNQGNGKFVEIANSLGVDRPDDPTFQATFIDYDRNGSSDLYVCNDHGNPDCSIYRNHMFQNLGGSFVEVTDETGTEACVGCMGVGVGDVDRNGWLDLYCTNIPDGNVLLMNEGDGTFTEDSSGSATQSYAVGWGNIFFDHDNDGILDIYVCNSNAPNRLYDCGELWPCTDVGPAMGVATVGMSYCVSAADIDDDGDLDLLVATDAEPIRLYINHEDGANNWLKIKLAGNPPNTHAIGAVVTLREGLVEQIRDVRSTIGFKSSWPTTVHFGLGDESEPDQISIRWPGGAETTIAGLNGNQTLVFDQSAVRSGAVSDLMLERIGGGEIGLTWAPSCSAGDTDYAIYEGVLGDFKSHEPVTCSTVGAQSWDLSPMTDSHYYLVVPRQALAEGSHGAAADGNQRLRGPISCVEQRADTCQ